ncbi:MAG: nucleotide exchange factor GrpE [Verrucomicrobiota bacterium]|nr:nucleotide exchange factor GrpE [Verrucomicrobiota bacterium]
MSNPTTEETPAPDAAAAEIPAPEPPAEAPPNPVQADLDRFKDLAMRTQADFENFRKRAAREKEDAVKYANATLLERLLPVLDNFELGLEAARQNAQNAPILVGMEMVARQLSDFLAGQGVEPVSAQGESFDPNLHEAVAQEESAGVPEGHVIRQLRKGFKLRDRLLRPATVVVSKGPAQG